MEHVSFWKTPEGQALQLLSLWLKLLPPQSLMCTHLAVSIVTFEWVRTTLINQTQRLTWVSIWWPRGLGTLVPSMMRLGLELCAIPHIPNSYTPLLLVAQWIFLPAFLSQSLQDPACILGNKNFLVASARADVTIVISGCISPFHHLQN